jgi:hypothetical protein
LYLAGGAKFGNTDEKTRNCRERFGRGLKIQAGLDKLQSGLETAILLIDRGCAGQFRKEFAVKVKGENLMGLVRSDKK